MLPDGHHICFSEYELERQKVHHLILSLWDACNPADLPPIPSKMRPTTHWLHVGFGPFVVVSSPLVVRSRSGGHRNPKKNIVDGLADPEFQGQ